ncbi:hypothetical protein SAMD00019534_109070 [Acytostelium subglobosum LB1]|uniref:hypothetical protein n=1 Tax=Acytostelium subglobosum LB1 TaxID=1410327 RepID=UPI00064517F5|nr:hypothetical protein SAMD00019534_109070 [Acytostelium subglobosum LB1]GAM27731.1 hypothetical protein SAMD00019534_109070 [Acytostelium subglobosum LB1]|eukprot:XP_012749390.1 hypothetical protein SAMD00019534_109070 [Acytostelium subglobosum LB1]
MNNTLMDNNNNRKPQYSRRTNNTSNYNNANNNNNNMSSISPVKAAFSEAVVAKEDVGEFKEGYFIMSPNDDLKMKRPNISHNANNTNNKPNQQRRRTPTNQPQYTNNYNNNYNNNSSYSQRSSDDEKPLKPIKTVPQFPPGLAPTVTDTSLVLQDFLLTPDSIHKISSYSQPDNSATITDNTITIDYSSPKKSFVPPLSKQPQTPQRTTDSPKRNSLSPRFDSPKKAPQSNFWSGGAFNNSPAPNALPMPNFDDFQPQQSAPNLQSMTVDLRRLLNITPVSVSD